MTDTALHADTHEIVIDEVFPQAPQAIWKTLTTRELISRWLKMTPTAFAPAEGETFTMQTTPAGAWDGVIRCRVLEAIENERLAYSWSGGDGANVGYGSKLDTIVTWTLSRVQGGTRVRMVHSGFVLPRNATAFKGMGDGWKHVIQAIGALSGELDG